MLTRSEVFALAKKATRGAGFTWGMAEEAAAATLTLYIAGYDGFSELALILVNADGKEQPLSVTDRVPCGLTLGTYLADLGKKDGDKKVIGNYIFQALCGTLHKNKTYFPDDAPQVVKDFAHRTYVPDSEESRLRGAG